MKLNQSVLLALLLAVIGNDSKVGARHSTKHHSTSHHKRDLPEATGTMQFSVQTINPLEPGTLEEHGGIAGEESEIPLGQEELEEQNIPLQAMEECSQQPMAMPLLGKKKPSSEGKFAFPPVTRRPRPPRVRFIGLEMVNKQAQEPQAQEQELQSQELLQPQQEFQSQELLQPQQEFQSQELLQPQQILQEQAQPCSSQVQAKLNPSYGKRPTTQAPIVKESVAQVAALTPQTLCNKSAKSQALIAQAQTISSQLQASSPPQAQTIAYPQIQTISYPQMHSAQEQAIPYAPLASYAQATPCSSSQAATIQQFASIPTIQATALPQANPIYPQAQSGTECASSHFAPLAAIPSMQNTPSLFQEAALPSSTSCISAATLAPLSLLQLDCAYNLTLPFYSNISMAFKLERNQYEYQPAQKFCASRSPGVYCYSPSACSGRNCMPSAMISCPDGVFLRCIEGYSCSDQAMTGSTAQCLSLRDLIPRQLSEKTPRLVYYGDDPAFEVEVGGQKQTLAPQRCLGPLPRLVERMAQFLERSKSKIRELHAANQQLQIQGNPPQRRGAARSTGMIISPQGIIIGPRETAHGPISGTIIGGSRRGLYGMSNIQAFNQQQQINPEAPEEVAIPPIFQQQQQRSEQGQAEQAAQQTPEPIRGEEFVASVQGKGKSRGKVTQRQIRSQQFEQLAGQEYEPGESSQAIQQPAFTQQQNEQNASNEQEQSSQNEQEYSQQPLQFITGPLTKGKPRRSFEVCHVY